jgi:hypothetical protein
MPTITVTARQGAPEETSADTRVVGLFEGEQPPDGALARLVESGEAKAKPRKLAVTHEDGGRRVIAVGLGKREEFDAEAARIAAGSAAQRARELGARSLSWRCPTARGPPRGSSRAPSWRSTSSTPTSRSARTTTPRRSSRSSWPRATT